MTVIPIFAKQTLYPEETHFVKDIQYKDVRGLSCTVSAVRIITFFFSVPLDEKVPEGVQPRFWEEEGFYVGKPPQVSPANLNIMENRIKDANEVLVQLL